MGPRGINRPERVGAILRERIRSLGWEARLREEELYTRWEEAVGPQIAAHARPSHVANGRLTVVTESPVWTQQLSFLRRELLARVARLLGPGTVSDLYFVTGRIDAPAPPAADAPPAPGPPSPLPEELERDLAAIGDEEVRAALRALCQAGLRQRRG